VQCLNYFLGVKSDVWCKIKPAALIPHHLISLKFLSNTAFFKIRRQFINQDKRIKQKAKACKTLYTVQCLPSVSSALEVTFLFTLDHHS